MGQALLTGDAPNEDDGAPTRVNAMFSQDARLEFTSFFPFGGLPFRQVNAVVDDSDLRGVDLRVAAQNVIAHAIGDGDNRGCGLVSALLHVRGNAVAAAELLGLPGAQGFEGVCGDDVGDTMEKRGKVSGEVRVPGVRVDEVRALAGCSDRKVDAQSLQGSICAFEFCKGRMSSHSRVCPFGPRLARAVESLDAKVLNTRTEHLR